MTNSNGQAARASAWDKFSAFEIFGDHTLMGGFHLVVRIGVVPSVLEALIEARAQNGSLPLDPELAQLNLRAGLGLIRTGLVEFLYATPEDTLAVVEPTALARPGDSLRIRDQLISVFASRLALLLGQQVAALGNIYEFPDLDVIRRALGALQEAYEQDTPLRSSMWLGAQLRGRGLAFHSSMIESLEEQTSLLESHDVEMDALPTWWWRGVAARVAGEGEQSRTEVYDPLPTGSDLGALIGTP